MLRRLYLFSISPDSSARVRILSAGAALFSESTRKRSMRYKRSAKEIHTDKRSQLTSQCDSDHSSKNSISFGSGISGIVPKLCICPLCKAQLCLLTHCSTTDISLPYLPEIACTIPCLKIGCSTKLLCFSLYKCSDFMYLSAS
jgi:hypothetical protein